MAATASSAAADLNDKNASVNTSATAGGASSDAFNPSLSMNTQHMLNIDKIQMRKENEIYLRQHPEIKDIIGYFTREVLLQRPKSVAEFAVEVLSDPKLKERVAAFRSEEAQESHDEP